MSQACLRAFEGTRPVCCWNHELGLPDSLRLQIQVEAVRD